MRPVQERQATLTEGDPKSQQIAAARQLLVQLIDQDVDLTGGLEVLPGTARRPQYPGAALLLKLARLYGVEPEWLAGMDGDGDGESC